MKVLLKKTEINGKPFLQFDFNGHLTVEAAHEAIGKWKTMLTENEKTNLIYNCLEMTNFDTAARKAWQSTMAELKPQTGRIWIISSNAFILGAAKTMGLLTGFDIKIAKSIESVIAQDQDS